MRKTAIFKDSIFLEHKPGFDHPESPDRLAVIYEQLDNSEIAKNFTFPPFKPADKKIIELNHTPEHVAQVASTSGKTFDSLDPDTHTSPKSYEAACMAVGALVKGTRMIEAGEIDNCFALVRPPGHHAERDQSRGFCLFNNVAIAARYALNKLGLDRILIVDWDLHHGNGTQHSFYDTDKVLYFSTHQYPYYPGTGALTETGAGKGEGYTINVPLRGGQDEKTYATIFNEILVPIAHQYKPQMIMVSAGYDIYHGDPLGLMAVSPAGFAFMTRTLVNLAEKVCNGRILFTLEGGYNLQGMKDGVLATLYELAGITDKYDAAVMIIEKNPAQAMVVEEIRNIAKRYWNM
jgi:acetoin utilization deacetylase AcuC-like enzyme